MTILPPPTFTDRIYNLISTIANLLALLISSVLLCSIIYRFHHFKISTKISILLSANTLSVIIIRSVLQFIDIDLNTIQRNYFSRLNFDNSFPCQLRGYILLSIHVTLYWSYALHAFFRFVRVIFPKASHLQQSSIYIYLFIPGQIVISFISILPLFRGFNAIYLLPNEPYCTASYSKLASLIYMPIVAFILPLLIISMCYICILWKTRHSKTSRRPYQKRNERDFIVLRRIIIILAILSMVSLPLFVDLFIYLPKGSIDPHMNSIGWLSSSLNAVVLAMSIPFINPRIRELFRRTINIASSI